MIHLLQVMCPERHCLFALAGSIELKEEALRKAHDIVHSGMINPWCGICGSHLLTYEWRATAFATMDEAQPVLAKLHQDNMASRKLLDALGMTYDSQRGKETHG